MRPFLLMMGPPCTMFSQLVLSNWFRMDEAQRTRRLEEACGLLDMCVWLAEIQCEHDDYYVIENPEGCQMWSRPNVPRRLMQYALRVEFEFGGILD